MQSHISKRQLNCYPRPSWIFSLFLLVQCLCVSQIISLPPHTASFTCPDTFWSTRFFPLTQSHTRRHVGFPRVTHTHTQWHLDKTPTIWIFVQLFFPNQPPPLSEFCFLGLDIKKEALNSLCHYKLISTPFSQSTHQTYKAILSIYSILLSATIFYWTLRLKWPSAVVQNTKRKTTMCVFI